MRTRIVFGGLVLLAALALAACSSAASTPTPPLTTASKPNPFASVRGIVDPANLGWPRQAEGLNGLVTIKSKPKRIVTLSVGHDEITYALVPAHRVIAVGGPTKTEAYSNVAALTQAAATVTSDPESILAQGPDIMVTSRYVRPELIDTLTRAGLTVVQTGLKNDPEGRINDILLMGYIYGEEERAIELAAEVQARYESLVQVTHAAPANARPRVVSLTLYFEKLYTAGSDSTEGGIIEAAGGVNVAAEAGLEANPIISLESVIAMAPEVIVIPQPGESGEVFRRELLANQALAQVPAIRQGRVHLVDSRFFTTLSFWNLRGAEELAKTLWPEVMRGKEFPPFSLPK